MDVAQTYNSAMQAFAQGDWQACSTGLEQVTKLMTDVKQQAQLEGVYFTLGAAYFNTPNFPKAIETFQRFLTQFPNSTRLPEVRLALAQAFFQSKQFEEGIKFYVQLETLPQYREQALAEQVKGYRELGNLDDAIRVLEKIVGADIRTSTQATAAITLAQMLADKGNPERAVLFLQKLQTKTALIENLVMLNGIAVKLGDEFAEKKRYQESITAYRAVRSREEVLKFQSERIAGMERRMEANLKAAAGNPVLFAQMTQTNNQIKEAHADAKSLLGEFEKLPDFTPSLLFRMARVWYDWDKKWESIVVFDRIIARYPKAAERESALFGMLIAFADVSQPARCQQLCEQYIKEFPGGPNAGTVGYLSGAVALQAQDFAGAESYFGVMLDKQPDSTYREEMRFLLGNAKFMQGKYAEAQKDYAKYLADFPQGTNVEDVHFRIPLAHLFAGEFETALAGLKAYLEKYPGGSSVADARYRVAVCKYAAQEYEAVTADAQSWLKDYPNHVQEGEVQALLGDSLAPQNKLEEAVTAYTRAYQSATTDEVLNYSLFEASKYLQKLGKWREVSAMFEGFVRDKPDHASVVTAMYWIGKARAREGKVDEAKQFLVETLKKFINEPKREAVEQLLTQLAQLCVKRPRPAKPLSPSAPTAALPTSELIPASNPPPPATQPVATPPPVAEPPPFDAVAELEKHLARLQTGLNATGEARILFARAEFAGLRKLPAQRGKFMREIVDRFKPQDLSPVLLAQLGDMLWEKSDRAMAETFYTRLKEDFPKSDYLDFAYVGLGEIALSDKKYTAALELFTDAIEKVGASLKLKEATLGRAKALLELERYEESRRLFEQVASVREWRGESTAFAVYSLGEIQSRQSKWAEAIAHYRRVFVAYQKYLPWVAKSYLKAATSFDKMGKRQDAIENLREMLRNERLHQMPEAAEARKLLQEWGAPA